MTRTMEERQKLQDESDDWHRPWWTDNLPAEPPAGIYRHFKGGYYRVVECGTDTETRERVVIYKNAAQETQVRPMSGPNGFCTPVADRELDGGEIYTGPRFELVYLLEGLT
jgi:hypothetical protein